jgi:hypothetical protein
MIDKKKRAFSVLCFSFLFAALLSAQDAPKDLIVLVDTSASMSSFYTNVTNYLTGPFLDENLNLGDTFHLISFSGKPRFEIARRVIDLGDVQTINGRIFLLYPLEPVSDISSAISYGEKYTTILPQGRQKRIFIVSDSEEKDVAGLLNASAGRLQSGDTSIRYLKVPFAAQAPSQNRPPSSPASETSVSQPASSVQAPSGSTASPAATASPSPAGSPAEALPDSPAGEPGPATEPVSSEPPALSEAELSAENQDSQTGSNASAEDGTAAESGERFGSFISSLPLPLLIALGILVLLILGFVIIMTLRNLNSSPNRVMASVTTGDNGAAARNAELLNSFASTTKAASRSSPHRRYHRDDQNQFLSNPPMLNLFVEDQNTAIGRRNVHTLKPGSRFTVGGGGSDFLIFLVPIPPRIGELRFDGTNCTFIPQKSKYFPDIGSQQVPECIGKPIRVLSDKHYELFFHFERYKDPLIALNQLLHSINVPEK